MLLFINTAKKKLELVKKNPNPTTVKNPQTNLAPKTRQAIV